MTSSPAVGEDASAAAAGGVAAVGLSCAAGAVAAAAGAVAAVELSCANATPPQRQLPSAIAHAIWFLIISFRKSRGNAPILSGAAGRLNCGGACEAASGAVGATYHLQQEYRRCRARGRRRKGR